MTKTVMQIGIYTALICFILGLIALVDTAIRDLRETEDVKGVSIQRDEKATRYPTDFSKNNNME